MELRRTLAGLDKLCRGLFVPIFLARAMRGDREHVQVAQLAGLLRPERLERVCRVRPALREKIAKSQQVPGLQRVRLVADHRLERRYSFQEFLLPEIGEADVRSEEHTSELQSP